MKVRYMTMVLVGLLFFAPVSGTGNAVVRAGGEGCCILSCESWSAASNGTAHGSNNHTLCGYLNGTTGTAYIGAKFTVMPVTVHALTSQTYSISWEARTRSNAYVGGGSFSNVCCVDGTYDANSGNTVSFSDPSLDPLLDDHAGCWGKFKVTIAAITATGGNCCHESMTFEFKVAYWPCGSRVITTALNASTPLPSPASVEPTITYTADDWVSESQILILSCSGTCLGDGPYDDPSMSGQNGMRVAAYSCLLTNCSLYSVEWTAQGVVHDDYGSSEDTITFAQEK